MRLPQGFGYPKILPQNCGDTMRWLADKVAKALFNVIDMPCDTKA